MDTQEPHPARQPAEIAMEIARRECILSGLNPKPYYLQLTELVIYEVTKAMEEMAQDQANGGPSAIIMLTQPFYQQIYFKDAGRLAGKSLLDKLNIKSGNQIH